MCVLLTICQIYSRGGGLLRITMETLVPGNTQVATARVKVMHFLLLYYLRVDSYNNVVFVTMSYTI